MSTVESTLCILFHPIHKKLWIIIQVCVHGIKIFIEYIFLSLKEHAECKHEIKIWLNYMLMMYVILWCRFLRKIFSFFFRGASTSASRKSSNFIMDLYNQFSLKYCNNLVVIYILSVKKIPWMDFLREKNGKGKQDWEKFKFQEILSSLMKIVWRKKMFCLRLRLVWGNKWSEFSQIKRKFLDSLECFLELIAA